MVQASYVTTRCPLNKNILDPLNITVSEPLHPQENYNFLIFSKTAGSILIKFQLFVQNISLNECAWADLLWNVYKRCDLHQGERRLFPRNSSQLTSVTIGAPSKWATLPTSTAVRHNAVARTSEGLISCKVTGERGAQWWSLLLCVPNIQGPYCNRTLSSPDFVFKRVGYQED
jgi:hypothetical protein